MLIKRPVKKYFLTYFKKPGLFTTLIRLDFRQFFGVF